MAVKPLLNETELLAKIAEGDQRAFTILFDHYERDVFMVSEKLTRSEDHAVEVVQEIFIKIWMSREKLPYVENFGGYLNKIIRNHSFDVLRQIAREQKSYNDLQLHFTEIGDSTSQQMDYNDALIVLNDALALLAPQQKLTYELCHQNGLKYEEAALQMNISIETVRSHMKQALKKIREHFRKNAIIYPLLILALSK